MTKNDLKTIAMICAQYPPQSGPGPTRMAAFAKGLAQKGYSPQIFTTKITPGSISTKWFKLENIDQLHDERAGLTSGRGRQQFWYEKLVNFFVPMEPTWTLSLRNLRHVFKKHASSQAPDVIFTTSNPLASAVGGAILKRKNNIPLIVEFRDPWSLNPLRSWPTWIHFFIESLLEKWVLRTANAVIMNTPTAKADLLQKYKWLDGKKVHAISHGFDEAKLKPGANNKAQAIEAGKNTFTIAYTGGFYTKSTKAHKSKHHARIYAIRNKFASILSYSLPAFKPENRESTPKNILKAIANYNQNKAPTAPFIKMDFIGSTANQLSHYIRDFGLESAVNILPRVPSNEVHNTLQQYDMLYLTNPAIPHSPFINTKTFDYLATGRPILAELPECDQKNLIETANAGYVVPPHDYSAIEHTLKKIIASNGQNPIGYQANVDFINLFARDRQIEDLIDIIGQVTELETASAVVSKGYLQMPTLEQKDLA